MITRFIAENDGLLGLEASAENVALKEPQANNPKRFALYGAENVV